MELNPNHPTTSAMRDHWHKIAAILVARLPGMKTTIPLSEIERVAGLAITMKEVPNGLEFQVITMDEGRKLAAKEGGLPV